MAKIRDRKRTLWGVVLMPPRTAGVGSGDRPMLLYDSWDRARLSNVGPRHPLSFESRKAARAWVKNENAIGYFVGRFRIAKLNIRVKGEY